ncbi:MAG: hypothetical protein BWZ10_01684 [candidate division BRC1 bacterium ADurb.BinA364]|nr:MAG: hypothetical protein BWZ10_01684 [candidate division BRC1 bacterium ADurb.BinA364]
MYFIIGPNSALRAIRIKNTPPARWAAPRKTCVGNQRSTIWPPMNGATMQAIHSALNSQLT